MITLVHGNDSLTSREYFLSQKDKNSITFDAEEINIIELAQSLQGEELFGASRKIFIENLFTKKGSKNIETIASILKETNETKIYIWSDKEIGVRSLSNFPKFESKNFNIPQNIWSFLDGIRPNNPKNIGLFHSVVATTEPEIVFSMIVRQFRLLLGIRSDSKKNAEEINKLASWQRSKLSRQASLFGIEKLKDAYRYLYRIDKSTKTGKTNLNLVQSIDIFLINL